MGITATTRTGNSFIGTPIDGLGKKMQCTPEAVNGRQPARIHEIKMCFASVFRYNRSRSSSLMDLPRKLSTVYSRSRQGASEPFRRRLPRILVVDDNPNTRSEEHTSELQSLTNL